MISPAGLDAIREHEGLRLKAYDDAVGVRTIGYGHTRNVPDTCTKEQAEAWLLDDCAEAESAVDRYVTVPLTQGQRDALISFVFNLGASRLATSTLLKKLNAGDYSGAGAEFDRWVHAGGRVLPGLVSRRAVERAMFEADLSTNVPKTGTRGEHMAPFIAAAIPALIQAVPDLIKIFGHGEIADRNAKAAELVAQIAVEATGSTNVQDAVEQVTSSQEQATRFRDAVKAGWYELVEVGGGVEGARRADAAFTAKGEPVWRSPSFLVAVALLPLAYAIVGSVVGLWGHDWPPDVRAAIATAVVSLVIGAVSGYYFGQTTSRNRT